MTISNHCVSGLSSLAAPLAWALQAYELILSYPPEGAGNASRVPLTLLSPSGREGEGGRGWMCLPPADSACAGPSRCRLSLREQRHARLAPGRLGVGRPGMRGPLCQDVKGLRGFVHVVRGRSGRPGPAPSAGRIQLGGSSLELALRGKHRRKKSQDVLVGPPRPV